MHLYCNNDGQPQHMLTGSALVLCGRGGWWSMCGLYVFTCGPTFSIITNQVGVLIATLTQRNEQYSSFLTVRSGSERCSIMQSGLFCGTGTSKAHSALVVDMQLYWVIWLWPWQPSWDGRLCTASPPLLWSLSILFASEMQLPDSDKTSSLA